MMIAVNLSNIFLNEYIERKLLRFLLLPPELACNVATYYGQDICMYLYSKYICLVLGRYINYVIHRLYCIHYLIPCMLSATRMAVDGGYRNFISFKCGSYLEYFSINLHIFSTAMATELWIWNWTDTTYIRTLVCFLVKKLTYFYLMKLTKWYPNLIIHPWLIVCGGSREDFLHLLQTSPAYRMHDVQFYKISLIFFKYSK